VQLSVLLDRGLRGRSLCRGVSLCFALGIGMRLLCLGRFHGSSDDP
jgi:hypothetical protein